MHSPSCIQAFSDSDALFRFARGLFKHTTHGYLSVLSHGEKDSKAYLVRNGNRGMRPVLWLVPAFRCLIYELPPFDSVVSTIPTHIPGPVVRHQRSISVRLHAGDVALRSENAFPANPWSALNTLPSVNQAPGPGYQEEPDSDFLIFADEDSQESDLSHLTAAITPRIGTARPSLHYTIPQIAERVRTSANLVYEQAENHQSADGEGDGVIHAAVWTDTERGNAPNVRQPPSIQIDQEERRDIVTAITRHNVRQLFPSLGRRRPLPAPPIHARPLSPFPQTPRRSSLRSLEDAFWARSYTPRHIGSPRTERTSPTELPFAPSAGARPRSQSEPGSEGLHRHDVLPEERSATSAQYYEGLGQEPTSDRVEVLTAALLRGQRLRRSTDPELYCLTEADDHQSQIGGPRYERPANPEPPSPLSANAPRIIHESSRLEPEITSHADVWSSTPATDPHAPPIYLITAHEPGRANRRPYTSYYTFSAVPFNLNGRSALTTPVIDEFWADEDFHHAETIVGSPLFRGQEDVERLDEALERIEVSLRGADFDFIGDDADKENKYPHTGNATSNTTNDTPSSHKDGGDNEPKSAYELWKERQDPLKGETDPEVRRKVLGEVAQILHERTKVRTRGLRDPFVRSHQEEADAEQERLYRQRNRALALGMLTGTANSPERSPRSQASTTVLHRRALTSPMARRLSRTDPPREARSMVYSALEHPTPHYPPGFFRFPFLNREGDLRARTEPPRRSEPARTLSPETFHVMNAPVQFRDDLPHTPGAPRISTSMAMRMVGEGDDSPELEDQLFNQFLANLAAGEGS